MRISDWSSDVCSSDLAATYWLSPLASWFQTMNMAMQRASPMRIRPVMYSGLSLRKMTASANISPGPMNEFWISEIASTRFSSNTRSDDQTAEIQSLMRIPYGVFCSVQTQQKKKKEVTSKYK